MKCDGYGNIEPQVFERQREAGGWLAVSPPWGAVGLGAVGQSEADARRLFREIIASWDLARAAEADSQAHL